MRTHSIDDATDRGRATARPCCRRRCATASRSRTSAGTRALSVAGNCRICMVKVEGVGELGATSPATCRSPKACTCSTDSERRAGAPQGRCMQFITLNHPVDCGICDKAGECTLQDYHYAYNGAPLALARREGTSDQAPRALRAHPARQRALHPVLALRALHARDLEVERARHPAARRRTRSCARVEDGAFDDDPYSDNVIDLCPVGALLSRAFLLQGAGLVPRADALGLPGLRARLQHRHLASQEGVEAERARPGARTRRIDRVTPLENPEVNGPWICNKGRDLAQIFERPRALTAPC